MFLLLVACRGEKQPAPSEISDTETTPAADTTDTGSTVTDTPDTGTTDTGTPPEAAPALQFDGDLPRNLIYVSLDTTRRDYLGRFTGNGNTPNLDRILSEGLSLDDHRSCSSWTGPSMTCAVTGNTAFELGWWPWSPDDEIPAFDADLPTISAQLKFQKGYNTALVTANTVFGAGMNFDNGFDDMRLLQGLPAAEVSAEALTVASDLMSLGSPFYLHVHYFDPHGNYCPPEEYVDQADYIDMGVDLCEEMNALAIDYPTQDADWQNTFRSNLYELYDAEIEYWDSEFGLFLEALDAMGALDDTLVVFVTDHGEQIFERDRFGHGLQLGAEEIRASAGFWAKNIVPVAWEGTTVHQDVAVTLQEHFEVAPPQETSGMLVGMAPPDRVIGSMLYSVPGQVELSAVRGSLQLTYDWWGEVHLYDHDLDEPGLIDYYDPSDPDVVSLQVSMQELIDEIEAQWPSAGAHTPAW